MLSDWDIKRRALQAHLACNLPAPHRLAEVDLLTALANAGRTHPLLVPLAGARYKGHIYL